MAKNYYRNNFFRNSYFQSESEKFDDYTLYTLTNSTYHLTIIDDMGQEYSNILSSILSPIMISTKSLMNADICAGTAINYPDAKEERIQKSFGNLIIIDGSYTEGKYNALDVRNKILKADISYYDKILFLVGQDILDRMDSDSPEYKKLMNINYTPYTNKIETMKDFILKTTEKQGVAVREFDSKKESTTSQFLEVTGNFKNNLRELIKDFDSKEVLQNKLKKIYPQNDIEQNLLDMVIKSYEDGDILRHALGQLYGSMQFFQSNLKVDDSITRESSDNNNPNNLDTNILGCVNQIFQACHNHGVQDNYYFNLKFLSSTPTSTFDDLNKIYFLSSQNKRHLNFEQYLNFISKQRPEDLKSTLYLLNPQNESDLIHAIDFKKEVESKDNSIDNIKILVDKSLTQNLDEKDKENVTECDNINLKSKEIIEGYAKEKKLPLVKKLPSGNTVRQEILDLAVETKKYISNEISLINQMHSDKREVTKLKAISPTELRVISMINSISPQLLYYGHTSSHLSLALTFAMESIKDNENIIIDENNTQPELSYEELIDKNEQEFLSNALNNSEDENNFVENSSEMLDEDETNLSENESDVVM